MEVRLASSGELSTAELRSIRTLLDRAFEGEFSDDDWSHTIGGTHALVEQDGVLVAHGSIVERPIEVGERRLRVGYVEGVATEQHAQGRGAATAVMRRIGDVARQRFELGALSTGTPGFYERLGWERWQGPTAVRRRDGSVERTPDDDDGIMILRTPATATFTPPLDLTDTITCDDRPGDVW